MGEVQFSCIHFPGTSSKYIDGFFKNKNVNNCSLSIVCNDFDNNCSLSIACTNKIMKKSLCIKWKTTLPVYKIHARAVELDQ